MAAEKQRSEGFKEFLSEYEATKIPETGHINSSQFDLKQQLKRFAEFSHNENESETMLEEANF